MKLWSTMDGIQRGKIQKSLMRQSYMLFQRYLKMLVPLLHLETKSGVENARKMPLSRRCTARNVTSATEGYAGKIILNWLPKIGDRIKGILKKTVKRLLHQLLQVRTLDLDMVFILMQKLRQRNLNVKL